MPHFRKRLLASWHFCCFFMYILYKTYIFLPKHEWSIHFSFVFMFQLFVCIKYTFLLRFHGDYPFWVPSSSSWPFQWVGGHHRKCPVVFRESQLTQTFLCTLNRYVWLRYAPPCRVCSLRELKGGIGCLATLIDSLEKQQGTFYGALQPTEKCNYLLLNSFMPHSKGVITMKTWKLILCLKQK